MSDKTFKIYERYMKRCLLLAQKAAGRTSPNPMVGAVILDKDLNFVSEGYHKKCGESHAEVNAINAAKAINADITGGTIIVNLEPCSHFGKTPPCADLIIKSGLKTVVVGCLDPNPKVSGNGIKKCRDAGLDTFVGVLECECKKLNEIFFKNQTSKMPFVAIKSAITLDGKIATKTGSSKWITGEKSRKYVQKLRNKYDAILTSSATVIADNPSLTCRMKNGRNPVRIVIDSRLNTSPKSKIYNNDGTKIILATTIEINKKYPEHVEIIKIKEKNGHVDLKELVKNLYCRGIYSILVEAGGILNGAFFKENLVNKLILFSASKITGDNCAKSFVEGFDLEDINNAKKLKMVSLKLMDDDVMSEYYVDNKEE